MWSCRKFFRQLLNAPRWIARSPRIGCRAIRGCILVALVVGQVGLPNFDLFGHPMAACQNPQSAPGTPCRCSAIARRTGRCCCSAATSRRTCQAKRKICHTKGSAVAKSCCRSKSTDTLALRNACPCGTGTETAAFRCADPRVLPPKLAVSWNDAPVQRDRLFDEIGCGELLPPPLPPPKA